jgi:hypothetical protein
MAAVLSKPQFQVFTHSITGEKTGRIYFPALFLAEFYQVVVKWLEYSDISFDERDIKKYGDGSFRLYFKTFNAHEIAYLRLMIMTEKSKEIAYFKQY